MPVISVIHNMKYMRRGCAEMRMIMTEKLYRKIKGVGACNLVLGIITLVFGVVTGILLIVNGARLLAHKSETLF